MLKTLMFVLIVGITGPVLGSTTVYTQNGCGPCHELLSYLNKNHINYQECNVTKSAQCMQDMVKHGWTMTPVTVVNGTVVMGPNGPKIKELVDRK